MSTLSTSSSKKVLFDPLWIPLFLFLLPLSCATTPAPISREGSFTSAPHPNLDFSQMEVAIANEVNTLRQREGRSILSYSAGLANVARSHSQQMAEFGYFAHEDRQGRQAAERAQDASYTCAGAERTILFAENLFETYRYARYQRIVRSDGEEILYDWKTAEELAVETVQAWYDSRGHRDNLLDKRPTHQGIGIAAGENGVLYVTQNLCK